MRIGLIKDGDFSLQVVRGCRYIQEMQGLLKAGDLAALNTAQEMEESLLLSRGYPKGSYPVPRKLEQEVSTFLWEDALAGLEHDNIGAAYRALQFIEGQRVFERLGISIVYVVVKAGVLTTVYLGALTQSEKDILWKFLWVDPGDPIA